MSATTSVSIVGIPVSTLRIAIVGDFDAEKRSHWATEAALFHAAARLGVALIPSWVATKSIAPAGVGEALRSFDGVWGAPGSPLESFEGMLCGIEFARQNNVPYLGTCAGFQYALIEFTRNVLGLADADTAENGSASQNIVITPIACSVPAESRTATSPRRAGAELVQSVPETLLYRLCGSELRGEYFCSFETNPDFVRRWDAAGLRVSGRGPAGEMRALDLPANHFFLATLLQPQLSSSFDLPHPIIEGYLRAALEFRRGSSTYGRRS